MNSFHLKQPTNTHQNQIFNRIPNNIHSMKLVKFSTLFSQFSNLIIKSNTNKRSFMYFSGDKRQIITFKWNNFHHFVKTTWVHGQISNFVTLSEKSKQLQTFRFPTIIFIDNLELSIFNEFLNTKLLLIIFNTIKSHTKIQLHPNVIFLNFIDNTIATPDIFMNWLIHICHTEFKHLIRLELLHQLKNTPLIKHHERTKTLTSNKTKINKTNTHSSYF